jgi:hypothetical protein
MSDSELSDAPDAQPNDSTLESTLRRVVRDALKSGDDITVRIARTRAEEELGLDADFFKQDAWKERSKNIINAAVEEPDSPVKPKPKAGRKRKSEEPVEKPKKRVRKSAVVESEDDDVVDEDEDEDEDDEDDFEEEEEKPKAKPKPKAKAKPQPKAKSKPRAKAKAKAESPVVESDQEEEDEEPASKPKPSTKESATIDSDAEDEPTSKLSPKAQSPTPEATKKEPLKPQQDSDNESEMSILIDDPPPKKKKSAPRQKKSASPGAKPTKKTATSKDKELFPDDEEIKRLQSWLLKCGIRKLWHRELANCDTPKAKIAHLKGMLTEAGMTGRFSAEKAKSIKEARELKEELEAAKDFEEKFGTGGRGRRAKKNVNLREDASDDGNDGEKEEGATRPGGRLLPKGLVDFGDSGDEGSD